MQIDLTKPFSVTFLRTAYASLPEDSRSKALTSLYERLVLDDITSGMLIPHEALTAFLKQRAHALGGLSPSSPMAAYVDWERYRDDLLEQEQFEVLYLPHGTYVLHKNAKAPSPRTAWEQAQQATPEAVVLRDDQRLLEVQATHSEPVTVTVTSPPQPKLRLYFAVNKEGAYLTGPHARTTDVMDSLPANSKEARQFYAVVCVELPVVFVGGTLKS